MRYEPRWTLTRLLGLSPAAELARRRFADSAWAGNGWPAADPRNAAQLARVTVEAWSKLLTELRFQRRSNVDVREDAETFALQRIDYVRHRLVKRDVEPLGEMIAHRWN